MQFRHFKGGLYDLICEATLESDRSPMMVYRASDGSLWVRPKSVFFELVEVNGQRVPRFAPVSDGPHAAPAPTAASAGSQGANGALDEHGQ